MDLTKTKIVAFTGRADYVRMAYADLKEKRGVEVLEFSCFNYYRKLCHVLHIKDSYYINYILSVLFAKKHCSHIADNVLLFHGIENLWMTDLPLINVVRKLYNAKIVGVFWDSIDFERYHVPDYKDRFDMIIHADPNLVSKYNLDYYPIAFFSKVDIRPFPETCDVFYCGEDGGRLPLMEKTYEKLTDMGLKCNFFCARSKSAGERIKGIQHIEKMPYREYLSHMLSSRIILDILKPGIQGPTLRYCEAVVYDKKVLTNNPIAKEMSVYDENQFYVFDESLNFDVNFLNSELVAPNNHKEDLSPERIVEFICSKFNYE